MMNIREKIAAARVEAARKEVKDYCRKNNVAMTAEMLRHTLGQLQDMDLINLNIEKIETYWDEYDRYYINLDATAQQDIKGFLRFAAHMSAQRYWFTPDMYLPNGEDDVDEMYVMLDRFLWIISHGTSNYTMSEHMHAKLDVYGCGLFWPLYTRFDEAFEEFRNTLRKSQVKEFDRLVKFFDLIPSEEYMADEYDGN